VVRGLPAGEYELRAKAWQLPDEHEAARYAYEQAEDKEDGCACTNAEIYAGPFSKRVKNYVSDEIEAEKGTLDNALRFVVLEIRYASASVPTAIPDGSPSRRLTTSAST